MTDAPSIRVFDGNGRALMPGGADLSQAEADACTAKSVVSFDSTVEAPPIARCWLLADGMTFDRIAPAEQFAAHAILRAGQGVLLLSRDPRAEASARCALLDLLDLDDTPQGRTGHA